MSSTIILGRREGDASKKEKKRLVRGRVGFQGRRRGGKRTGGIGTRKEGASDHARQDGTDILS